MMKAATPPLVRSRSSGRRRAWLWAGLALAAAGALWLIFWAWQHGGGDLLQLGISFC